MIRHTHLTAWQSYAPWPKRSQIEQDLRLCRGVAAIKDSAHRHRFVPVGLWREGTIKVEVNLNESVSYTRRLASSWTHWTMMASASVL